MSNSPPERNKASRSKHSRCCSNKRDYVAAERFWSPNYIQTQRTHSTGSRRTIQSRALTAGRRCTMRISSSSPKAIMP